MDDPHVRRAVRAMHEHLTETTGLELVLAHSAISRRLLETRFQKALQCAPYIYLCRLRVERAKKLLAQPERQKLQAVARACGFTSTDHLSRVFQRITGELPSTHRARVVK